MGVYPRLETERLVLRALTLADAPDVQRLAGDRAVYNTTLHIPHPYEDGAAEKWIGTHQGAFDEGKGVVFGIVRRADDSLVGSISLSIDQSHARAELGYWIGKPHWNQGYCTEAAQAVLDYGFNVLGLNKIFAHHFEGNPASGAVMRKLGMAYEGCLRQHVKKDERFVDLEQYSILKHEYEAAEKTT